MAKIYLICLILVEMLVIEAMGGDDSERSEVELAPSPSEIRRLGKHHADKSVAGGGVIIGGLVTAIFAAVFCYIRVTRKRDGIDAVR